MAPHNASDLMIYTSTVTNPYKLTILLEELGVPYTPHSVDLMHGENKADWYIKINPNGKLPALKYKCHDGREMTVWESATCLQYLVDQFDTEHKCSFPPGTQEYFQVLSWVAWQVSALGPFLGQSCHFLRYAYEHNPYGIKRYVAEANRLYGVLEAHLTQSRFGGKPLTYLVGEKYTIADIACYPWLISACYCGLDIDQYPAVKAWKERMAARERVKKGMEVPAPFLAADPFVKDPAGRERRQAMQTMVMGWVKQESEMNFREPEKGYMDF